MDSSTIRSMLDKYWEGETSLQEEDLLRQYFNQENVPKEFEPLRPMFLFFRQEQEAYLNGDFDERLSTKLKAVDNEKPRAHSLTFFIRRAAAVAAIFIGILFFVTKMDFINLPTDEIALNDQEKEDAKLAYAEAKAALLLISTKLKKGTSKAKTGVSQVRKATKVIK